jgi:hypothetical protein
MAVVAAGMTYSRSLRLVRLPALVLYGKRIYVGAYGYGPARPAALDIGYDAGNGRLTCGNADIGEFGDYPIPGFKLPVR